MLLRIRFFCFLTVSQIEFIAFFSEDIFEGCKGNVKGSG